MLKPAAVLQQVTTTRLARVCRNISLTLAACLVFLVPFDAARNIDLQGLLLLISGASAWAAILLGHRKLFVSLDRVSLILLGVFGVSCVVSLLVNPNFGYDFAGAPYIRLGAGGLLACIGIGLLAVTIARKHVMTGLYLLIIGLAILSVPYTWIHFHSLLRVGGVFSQADILACILGCGLLFGLEMLEMYPEQRRFLVALQTFLAVILFLTQTRAVLLVVTIIWLLWLFQHRSDRSFKRAGVYIVAVLLLFTTLHYALPSRLTNTTYASQSVSYRLTLQKYALRASQQKPIWGYGPGNLADALNCPRLLDKALQTTCDEGYFFNSSHNIFIDRVLAVGWLGGLAFFGLTLLAIYRGLRGKKEYQAACYALILISCYYLTNVTGLTLELLFWILLLQCLAATIKKRTSHV